MSSIPGHYYHWVKKGDMDYEDNIGINHLVEVYNGYRIEKFVHDGETYYYAPYASKTANTSLARVRQVCARNPAPQQGWYTWPSVHDIW